MAINESVSQKPRAFHMNKLAFILTLLVAHAAFAQQRQVSFGEIDERVKYIEPAPPAELANTLTKDYQTQREKFRAIFSWITDHISYRVKKNYTCYIFYSFCSINLWSFYGRLACGNCSAYMATDKRAVDSRFNE